MRKKLLNGCLVFLAAFICPAAYIIVVGTASFFSGYALFEEVDATLWYPENVTAGDSFTFVIEIQNHADQRHILSSIDIANTGAGSISIVGSKPAYVEAQPQADWQSFTYEESLDAQGSLQVEFMAVIDSPGRHLLQSAVCINNDWSCLQIEAEIAAMQPG